MWIFENPEIIFYYFFRIFNLDIFWVLIPQKHIGSRYLVPVTPTTVLSRSFWNFTAALRMVWRYACVFFRILKLFFITGFLLQYLGKWYRTNGPLVNLAIFNSSNKNKAGDINSLWNLLVYVDVTPVLLNLNIPCLCKQCRSRSVAKKPTDLDLHFCYSVCEFISTIWIK